MYYNMGIAEGSLAKQPIQVAEGIYLITLRIRDSRRNPSTGEKEFQYPTFTAFGKMGANIMEHLEKNQQARVIYKLETRRKEQNGKIVKFEDKVITSVTFGKKATPKTPNLEQNLQDQSNQEYQQY